MVEPTGAQLRLAARTLALLGAPVRLHLVALVAGGEHDVSELSRQVGVPLTTVSQQLTKLRLAGVVSGRRIGRRQIYTVTDPHVLELVRRVLALT